MRTNLSLAIALALASVSALASAQSEWDPMALPVGSTTEEARTAIRGGPAIAVPGPVDVDPVRYVDDRSGPVEVIRSYYNAINRREFDRAYSYWEPNAASRSLPPYPEFKLGFADTVVATLVSGEVNTDVGAGQLYYAVPVQLEVASELGPPLTYAGCFVLHLARPEIQDLPPFRPLAIQRATLFEVESADVANLGQESCFR